MDDSGTGFQADADGAGADGSRVAGDDASTCASTCPADSSRCAAGSVETCRSQATGCAAWTTTATCGSHQICEIGNTGPSCICSPSPCAADGAVCMDGATVATCATDGDGCHYVAATTACGSKACAGFAPSAACASTCTDSCASGHAACASEGVATCARSSNGCFAYGAPAPCVHGACSGTAGQAACCSTVGTCITPVAIAAGGSHSCALLSDGTVRCWGDNEEGELGDGTTTASPVPVSVRGLGGPAAAVAGGEFHTCALLSGGPVQCWGLNSGGQLGNGTTNDSPTPVSVSGLTGATAIVTGERHTCALLAGGTVVCWGENTAGQLGDGTMKASSTPVAVSGLSGVSALASGPGAYHTCASLSSGAVACWGDDSAGQLGPGSSSTTSSTPLTVAGLTGVLAIAAAGSHTCALLSGGRLRCWGDNTVGELGNMAAVGATSATPLDVMGISGAAGVAAAGFHTCALLADGTAACWGDNVFGQLGNGMTSQKPVPTPGAVSGLGGVTALAGGSEHTCALLTSGSIECWGTNPSGELGDGTMTASPVPVTVTW